MSENEKTVDPKILEKVTPELEAAVAGKTRDGRITCAVLRKIAEDMQVPYRVAGAAADSAGVKIGSCDLGCF